MAAKSTSNSKNRKSRVTLILIMAFGAFLRFYNLNWDKGLTFHPDERNIDAAVSRINFFDQLDPEFFAYGGLPVYLYRATGDVIVGFTHNPDWVHNWGKINIIGRTWSALFSTLTIAAIYFLAKRFVNKKYALLASLIAAFTPSFIQTAHFAITESIITLFAVLICLVSLKLYHDPKKPNHFAAGLLLGSAAAAKTSAISFLVFPAAAQVSAILREKVKIKRLFNSSLLFLITITVSGITFLLLSPYTVISWGKFMESMRYESSVVAGTLQVPYTHQFINTKPYIFQLKNLFWQMGIVALAALTGALFIAKKILFLVRKNKKNEAFKYLILVSFPLSYFAYVGSWHTKFIRYMVPLLPFLIIFTVILLHFIELKQKLIGKTLYAFFIFTSIFWGLAFFSVYTHGQTRITASKWIYENIPKSSKILGEHWDDGLPTFVEGSSLTPSSYDIEQLTIYEPDNIQKLDYYAQELSQGDYIVINSRRLYGTLINLPEKYPLTSAYYKLLFSGKLGYKKVAVISSYPSLLGVTINDDASEETFQVYDHPKVIILENKERLDSQEIRQILYPFTQPER